MARNRQEKAPKIPLAKADRSGPTAPTLLDIAEQRGLLKDYTGKADVATFESRASGDDDVEVLVGRLGDSILWSISLTMLHLTLDVLVTHQYSADGLVWPEIIWRTVQALPVIFLLMYSLHQHPTPSPVLPPLSKRATYVTHQAMFFVASVSAGCYLIHVTNVDPYYAVMKQAPALGCIWIWSVIELDILAAVGSLFWCTVFLKYGGYNFL